MPARGASFLPSDTLMTTLLLLQQVDPPTPSLLAPDAGLVFWVAVVFGLALFILWKYAWGPITEALNERETRIEDSMQAAEKALEEARKIQADNERARREAEQEGQCILREAREEAERLRNEEIQETRERIATLRDQAQEDIAREKQSALDDLRAEVADLAIEAAERILGEALDQSRHRKLVENMIEELPKN